MFVYLRRSYVGFLLGLSISGLWWVDGRVGVDSVAGGLCPIAKVRYTTYTNGIRGVMEGRRNIRGTSIGLTTTALTIACGPSVISPRRLGRTIVGVNFSLVVSRSGSIRRRRRTRRSCCKRLGQGAVIT